jgi:cell division protein FtsB
MLQFYEKRSWRTLLRSWWFVGVLGVICLFLLTVVFHRMQIEREMSSRRATAEAELAELRKREAELKDKVEYLGSERGMEAEMRRNFDVAQPGERVVIILDEKPEDATIEPIPEKADTPPWYIFWR